MKNYIYIFSLLLLISFFSCKRTSEKITTNPNAKLSFSQTVITFDTIFTSIGTITQRLWVYNKNSHALSISSIRLGKLSTSSYSFIINGQENYELSNYEIFGKDSLLVLIKVLINPQNKSLPYLVEDSLEFTTNGNVQDVDLTAYGQDAIFLTNTTVACNTTWTNIKPYVINGNVTVPAGCTLTVDLGTRIRFHKNATLTVAGTLIAQGNKDSIVTFRHDNLSSYYDDIAGQWGGLIFKSGSKNNHLLYTEIKNATTGISMYPEPDGDTIAELKIENSIVKNCSKNLITVMATDFYAVNSLLNNCVGYIFNASSGGNYYFDFCTLTNYSYDFFREASILRLSNQDSTISTPIVAKLRNTILWGDMVDEITLNNDGVDGFTFSADYSILKSSLTITNNNSLFNQDPLFTDEYNKKFTLKAGPPASPAINAGIPLPSITTDLVGAARGANPNMGCYE
jgi:hypothetical protein